MSCFILEWATGEEAKIGEEKVTELLFNTVPLNWPKVITEVTAEEKIKKYFTFGQIFSRFLES